MAISQNRASIDLNTREIAGIKIDLTNLNNGLSAGIAASMAATQVANRTTNGFRIGVATYNNEEAISIGGRYDDKTFSINFDSQDTFSASFGMDL